MLLFPKPKKRIKVRKALKRSRIKPGWSKSGKSKAETEHLNAVAELGCLVCHMPAEIHHIRSKTGLGMRSSHFEVLPLCPSHHRTGGHGIAFHAGPRVWQERYGYERDLLEKVNGMLRVGTIAA